MLECLIHNDRTVVVKRHADCPLAPPLPFRPKSVSPVVLELGPRQSHYSIQELESLLLIMDDG